MKAIKILELLGSRDTPLRGKRLLVLLGNHGVATTRAAVRKGLAEDHRRAVWNGIVKKAS
jgi:hypothetical protein